MEKMRDPVLRQACRDQYENPNKVIGLGEKSSEQDGGLGMSLRKLVYHSASKPENKQWENMSVADIAKARDQSVVDAFLDVSIEDELKNEWRIAANPVNLDELKKVLSHPYTLPGLSDGGAHTKYIT